MSDTDTGRNADPDPESDCEPDARFGSDTVRSTDVY
jgi:hypothetical protein